MSLVYFFDAFRFDAEKLSLWQGEQRVRDLKEKGGRVLLELLRRRRQEIVPFDELLAAVWPSGTGTKQNLATQVSNLNKIFLGHGVKDRFIVALPRQGYKLLPVVTAEGDEASLRSPSTGADTIRLEEPFYLLRGRSEVFGVGKMDRLAWAEGAREIDMMGLSLYSAWFRNKRFVETLHQRMARDDIVLRVLLPAAESSFYQQYLADYRSHVTPALAVAEVKRLVGQLAASRDAVTFIADAASKKRRPILRQLTQTILPCGIVRFDTVMKISTHRYPYQHGDEATLLVQKRSASPEESKDVRAAAAVSAHLFDSYKRSYDLLWENAE